MFKRVLKFVFYPIDVVLLDQTFWILPHIVYCTSAPLILECILDLNMLRKKLIHPIYICTASNYIQQQQKKIEIPN